MGHVALSLDKSLCQSLRKRDCTRPDIRYLPSCSEASSAGSGEGNAGRMRYPMAIKSFVFAEDWQMFEPQAQRRDTGLGK